MIATVSALTFERFRKINLERKARWHQGSTREWVGPDWGNELAGETGEACNIIKKLQRYDDGIFQAGQPDYTEMKEKLKKELGDIMVCVELVCEHYDLTLEECIRYAFNKTSEKNGFPERL